MEIDCIIRAEGPVGSREELSLDVLLLLKRLTFSHFHTDVQKHHPDIHLEN